MKEKKAHICLSDINGMRVTPTNQMVNYNGKYNKYTRVCDIECSSLDQIIPLIAK